MYKFVIIALLLQICLSKSILNLKSNNNIGARKKASGFIFSMPKTLVSGKNETVCVSLHEANLPAKVLVDLKWKDKHHTTLKNLDTDSKCFEMKVPSKRIVEAQFVSVRVQVQMHHQEIYSAHNYDPILIYPNPQNKVFIETDRGVYKPGDTLKFRILQLDRDFLPISTKVSNICIKNPMGITVMAWENIIPDHGLVSLDYQMVAESMIGKWKLQAENQTTFFEVAKYNVPRFKIDLKYPKIIYYKTKAINILVCGKYSNNKPVAGIAFIKISYPFSNMKSINELKEMINGCSEFKIDKATFGLDNLNEKMFDSKKYLQITATITEHGTNKMDVASGKSKILLKGYNIKFNSNPMFIPGMPYEGQLKLTNIITSIEDEVVEICYNLAIKKSWNYLNNEQCRNYSVPNTGIVAFKLWPAKNNVLHVSLHAKSLNNSLITDDFLIVRLFSPSSSYIQLEKISLEENVCNIDYQYKVAYSTDRFNNGDNITFYYTIKSSLEILEMGKHNQTIHKTVSKSNKEDTSDYLGEMHKYVKLGANIEHFTLNFQITKKFLTKYQLLIYYVTKDGETIAATKTDEIQPCSLQINSYWSQTQLLPGTMATLNIKSASPALCAISATDKATKFMSLNHQNVNLDRILKVFTPERESAKSGRNSCVSNQSRKNAGPSSVQNMEMDQEHLLKRRKRHIYSFAEDYDAYDIFSRFGTISITNLQLITKPCYNGPLVEDLSPVQFLTDPYDTDEQENSHVDIRSFFPENWLWELVPVVNSVQLQREVPHSITNWVTNVFCVSETESIGFTQETELSSFQPFFVEILTPHSMKKGETFNLLVHVNNYGNTFPIKISIEMSPNLQLSQNTSATYCLKQNITQTHSYHIAALETGLANVTVLVETESGYNLPCGPEYNISRRDAVFKSFKIEPEGYLMTNTKAVLLCANNEPFDKNITWNIYIPRDIVFGTGRVSLTINADLLGETIENLHQLLTIPTGCGEQIIASMAPNLYILRYLNVTGGLTASTRQRIVRNLKIGYQRILNYAHSDGSFSAFGYYDPSGSMFLTTFIVRVLLASKPYIYVDQRVVDKAVDWIFDHQLENGCFDTMHHVFQDMGGTNMENSTAGLTAYVIFSLFVANVNVPDAVQTNAKFCIRSQRSPDKYSMIISSYALFKVYWLSEARRLLEKAISLANIENDMMWWSTRGTDESYASDIEITSYAVLALLEQKTPENMAYAHSIVQWLTSKMGPTGGFRSTQDTVVALEALTKYAEIIHSDNIDLTINLEAHQETQIFAIKKNNRLKSKLVNLQSKDGEVKLQLSGVGCVLTQLVMSYFTTNISDTEAFKLAVEIAPVSNIDLCSIKSISPCVAYKGPDKLSNMVVMEVALPSGFQADRSSLYKLIQPGNNINMFEEKDEQINFYFTNLGKNQVCFTFNINENVPIDNRKEGLIKLYDYYRPEKSILQFYKIISNCSRSFIDGVQDKVEKDVKPESYVQKIENIDTDPDCLYLVGNKSQENRNILTYERDIIQNFLQDYRELPPKCIQVPINKTRKKRSSGLNAKNNSTINTSGFVDVSIEPEAPICMAAPFYIGSKNPQNKRNKRSVIWLRYKRNFPNKDFVDLDFDMEAPNCINIPFYVPFPSPKNSTNKEGQSQGINLR